MNPTKIVAVVAVVQMQSMHRVWQEHLLEPFEQLFLNLFRSEVLRFVACLRLFPQVCSLLLFRSGFFEVFPSVYDRFLRLPFLNLTRQYQEGHREIFLRRPLVLLRWSHLGIVLVGIELVVELVQESLSLGSSLHSQLRRP